MQIEEAIKYSMILFFLILGISCIVDNVKTFDFGLRTVGALGITFLIMMGLMRLD